MTMFSWKIFGTMHTLRLFGGPVPENVDVETTAIPLATLDLSEYNPPRWGFEGLVTETGTATFFRVYNEDSRCIIQGTAGTRIEYPLDVPVSQQIQPDILLNKSLIEEGLIVTALFTFRLEDL